MSFACSYFKEEIWAVGGYNRGSPLDTVEILTTRDGHVPLFHFVSFYIHCVRILTGQSFNKIVCSIKSFVFSCTVVQ